MPNKRQLEDINVMYIRTFGKPSKAFMELEKIVPLKGRDFYGVFNPKTKEYRACVKIKEGDNPQSLGLQKGIIQGGLYAYEIIKGKYNDLIKQIPSTFEKLSKEYKYDDTRPSIEYYKRFNEFILYLPILE